MPAYSNSLHVLVVENSIAEGMLLRECVEQLGAQVLGPATAADEALRLCKRTFPALAIIDVWLNGPIDGINLAWQLQRITPIPIIFISAADDWETWARMWHAKPMMFLPKPFDISNLQRIVSYTLHGLTAIQAGDDMQAGKEETSCEA